MESSAESNFTRLFDGDEWPLRWQRKLGLVPRQGMGLAQRAVFYALLAWAPLAVWAFLQGRALPGGIPEPLLAHFGINVRCLVAIPLLILAEGMVLRVTIRTISQLLHNGLVRDAQRPQFAALLRDVARLRDSSMPWIILLGITGAWMVVEPADPHIESLSWSVDSAGDLGFGGWWFAYVARPIFLALMLSWLWRIMLMFVLFRRISKLDLSLVATHPDRAGGLGFLEAYPGAFAPVTFALAAVVGSGWAHDLVYHGGTVEAITRPLAALAVVWTLLLLSPLLVFAPKLMAAKRQAKIDFGRLVGEQGRAVRQRWVVGDVAEIEPRNDELLEPAGVGPIADALSLYEAVTRMRAAPVGKVALLGVLLPFAVPMLAIVSIQIPIKTLLMQLLKMLV